MRKLFNLIALFLLVTHVTNRAEANNSPVPSENNYKVNDSLGSRRTTTNYLHIHNGVDLGRVSGGDTNIGVTITAIESGKFKFEGLGTNDEKVTITNGTHCFVYQHIESKNKLSFPKDGFKNDDDVTQRQVIGWIKHLDGMPAHLHLTERNDQRFFNPLLSGGLGGFTDTGNVKLLRQKTSDTTDRPIQFYSDETATEPLAKNNLKGKVDILVPVYDTWTPDGPDRVAVYRLGYEVRKENRILAQHTAFTFNNMPGNPTLSGWASGRIQHLTDALARDEFLYWATNMKGDGVNFVNLVESVIWLA